MPTLRDELSADLGKGVSLYEQSVEWDGNPYACTRKKMPEGFEFQDGGEVHIVKESILIPRSVLTNGEPSVGDGIDDNTAQIKSIDPNTECLILMIGSFDEA